jgi:HlyD family secretion protein
LWLILAAIAAAVVVLAAFISLRRGELKVHAERAMRENIMSMISTNGKIEPLDAFEAHAPAASTVKKVLVREGDWVKKGQLLLQLDDSNARAQAARATAQLRAAQADVNAVRSGGTREEVLSNQAALVKARSERDAARNNLEAMKRLQTRGAASAGEVVDAENRLKEAEANLHLLEQKQTSRFSSEEIAKVRAQEGEARASLQAAQDLLRNSNIIAPKEGIVYALPVRAGMFVNTGDLLVQVGDLSSMQVRAFVDEPDIGRLSKGQRVTVTWDALPGRTWEGSVSHVPTTVVVRGTRTVGEVTCVVDNHDLKLLPNVNVGVSIITMLHNNALTIPRQALHQENGKRYVFQIIEGELHRREVETSVANLTRIEITSGLPDNSLVAVNSETGQPLGDGAPVRVLEKW